MNRHYDNDIDLDDRRQQSDRDREISLGATTILGIFFALALVCAVFFGFGYTMGRKSAQPIASIPQAADSGAADTTSAASGDSGSSAEKTSAGTAETAPAAAPSDTTTTTADTPSDASGQPAQPTIKTVALTRPAAPAVMAPSVSTGAASIVVQVAAVSHKEDADILLSALKKRGYTGAIRQVPQDKLLHVQLGPFATKKDADAMKQRLIADGYTPIVK